MSPNLQLRRSRKTRQDLFRLADFRRYKFSPRSSTAPKIVQLIYEGPCTPLPSTSGGKVHLGLTSEVIEAGIVEKKGVVSGLVTNPRTSSTQAAGHAATIAGTAREGRNEVFCLKYIDHCIRVPFM